MKLSGLAEQYDGGRAVIVQQESALVSVSVECQSGANSGVALLTPSQARTMAKALNEAASSAEEFEEPS